MRKLKIILRKMIEIIVQRMTDGDINPLQAVQEIKQILGKIHRVDCKHKVKLTIADERNKHSVSQRGLNREQVELVEEMAVIAYAQAQADGSRRPGELHLGKGLSTKDYAGRLREYAGGLVARYAGASA